MKCMDIKKIKTRLLLIHYKRLKLGLVAIILLVVVLLISGPSLNQWSRVNSKGLPQYILDQQQFNTVDGARKYIKDVPFIEPTYVISGYNLKEITYTKTKEMSFSVDFSYVDRSYNTLNIVYTLKGSSNNYERTPFNPNCIKVDTGVGYSQPKGVQITKDNHLTELTDKSISVDFEKYIVTAGIHYNSKIQDSDKLGDTELVKIIQGYLNSKICYITENYKQKVLNESQVYSSFEDLKKNLPSSINIIEPKYVPQGFKLKNIVYQMVNPETNFFIIDATYENPDKSLLFIDYRLTSKGNVHQNNSNKIQTNNAYILMPTENGNAKFIPVTEKALPFLDRNFDLCIYLQYGENNIEFNQIGDKELQSVLSSISE